MAAARPEPPGRLATWRPATAFVVAVIGALTLAPAAGAAPQCTRTTPTTTQCETPGHSQITTSPPAMNNNPWWQFGGYGGLVIGFR